MLCLYRLNPMMLLEWMENKIYCRSTTYPRTILFRIYFDLYRDLRPLINDFLRKMAKFRHQENQDVSAGTRIRFFIDKPAAMISFPRAVIKYL
jgi:hypothetical protein